MCQGKMINPISVKVFPVIRNMESDFYEYIEKGFMLTALKMKLSKAC